jgi:hypothetical protein
MKKATATSHGKYFLLEAETGDAGDVLLSIEANYPRPQQVACGSVLPMAQKSTNLSLINIFPHSSRQAHQTCFRLI